MEIGVGVVGIDLQGIKEMIARGFMLSLFGESDCQLALCFGVIRT